MKYHADRPYLHGPKAPARQRARDGQWVRKWNSAVKYRFAPVDACRDPRDPYFGSDIQGFRVHQVHYVQDAQWVVTRFDIPLWGPMFYLTVHGEEVYGDGFARGFDRSAVIAVALDYEDTQRIRKYWLRTIGLARYRAILAQDVLSR